MSTLAMALAVTLAAESAPEKVSGEVEQRLDLSGGWEGRCWLSDHKDGLVPGSAWVEVDSDRQFCVLGRIGEFGSPAFQLLSGITETGHRRLYLRDGSLGLYRQESDRIRICIRPAGKGYPASCDGAKGEDLIILRRVKPGK